jgi:acyl-CoA synthetase (AMP-forming)/AMP-acid ligase II
VPFEKLTEAAPIAEPRRVDPREPAVIGFTSGTTSDPKGVIHSHFTIVAEARQLADMQSGRALPLLVGAPVGHAIGMLSGLLIPLCQGRAIHLIDVWDPPTILDAMLEADLTCGSGATYFLTSLLDAPGFTPEHLKRMTTIGLGGAPVPAAISDRAESLGISIVRSYGSTEHPSSTGAKHDEPAAKRKYTDGHALWGVELKLVDENGNEVAVGQAGEILSRGPDRFVGYTDPALSDAVLDADGWYASGDIGILDADGYLTITDRKKDIIIRGGENISAAEVEETLMRMPGVAEAAVVAAPDARFGEHACACLRMQPGHAVPDLATVQQHFAAAGLAKQKWPEEIVAVDDFPRTPSGKVKKFVLRGEIRARAAAPG